MLAGKPTICIAFPIRQKAMVNVPTVEILDGEEKSERKYATGSEAKRIMYMSNDNTPRRMKAYTKPSIAVDVDSNCSVLTVCIIMAIPKLANAKPPIAAGDFLKLSTMTKDSNWLEVSKIWATPASMNQSEIVHRHSLRAASGLECQLTGNQC